MKNVYPEICNSTPAWDLNLVLRPLFERLDTCSLIHLRMKVAFLVAIMSMWRVSKIAALTAYPPYTIFFRHKITLRPHPKFIPKISSSFPLNQPIHLPTFCPKPHGNTQEAILHTLDIRHAIAFYLERTKPFQKSPRCFVSMTEHSKGSAIATQRLSKCISTYIHFCYQQNKTDSPIRDQNSFDEINGYLNSLSEQRTDHRNM